MCGIRNALITRVFLGYFKGFNCKGRNGLWIDFEGVLGDFKCMVCRNYLL